MVLVGKKLIVVGAGSGIGRAVALAGARAGADLVLVGRTRDTLAVSAELAGGGAEIRVLDATREDQVAAFFAAVDRFDHLVCTIARTVAGPIANLRAEEVEESFRAKLWAPIFLVKHGSPRIADDGSFTFFSGFRGARPAARGSITSLVNGGLEAFARAMAVELGPVRVNVISPGVVDSGPFWGRLAETDRERLFDDFARRAPARRVGQPDQQADAVLFAIGNAFLTGTVLPVDGGGLLL